LGTLNKKITDIMERELGDLGEFIVKKQCRDLMLDFDNIQEEDLPLMANALSQVMSTFGGMEKAKRVYKEIKKLKDLDAVVKEESHAPKKVEMLLNLGDVNMVTGEWKVALDYYTSALDVVGTAGRKELESKTFRKIANLYKEKGQFTKAFEHYSSGLKYAQRDRDYSEVAENYRGIGYVHWKKARASWYNIHRLWQCSRRHWGVRSGHRFL